MSQVCGRVLDPTCPAIPELQHVTNASEKLARAGIDLLKSGFSHFGFTGSTFMNSSENVPHPSRASEVVVVFIVGGISFQEIGQIAQLASALEESNDVQLILGSTTISSHGKMLYQVFNNNNPPGSSSS